MTILYIWRADLETDTAAASLFGTPSNYKRIIESGFLLEGTADGATWSTIASDQYDFGPSGHGRREGFLYKRFVDDSSNAVDWASYFDWQDAGNDAFRVTMTVNNNGTNTTYTQKHITFASSIGVPGGPRAIQSGSKDVDEIGGWNVLATKLYSTDGRMWFDSTNGIFAKDVSGKPAFGLVNGTSVNVTDWGGASETLAQGDMLLGDNNTGKANLFYDASAGRLNFRSGTTVQLYLDTDGRLYAGGGKVVSDATGFYATDGTNRVFTIASTAYTLNGESLSVGDVIFGNNASLSANIKIASGGLTTRSGTTNYISITGKQLIAQNQAGMATYALTVTGATGANQDLDSTGFGSGGSPFYTNFVRVTSTGNWTLRSIVTGVDGQWLYLINESANNMTIANAGAAPAGYSAIRTFDGTSPATTNAGCALFIYNSTNGTWDLMSYRG